MIAYEPMLEWLRREDDFLLIAHVSPDGDTIGSCLALYGMLSFAGKRVSICCDQPVPRVYRFLPWSHNIKLTEECEGAYKNVVAIDCADVPRMGFARKFFERAEQTGNIDHHMSDCVFGDYCLRDHTAAATGELIFALWHGLNGQKGELAKDIAVCLYTAVSTDTGNFAYSNTTPNTFHVAAALLEYGVDIAAINREVYRTVSYSRTCLKGFVLSNIELFDGGTISYSFLSIADMQRFGATGEDLEGMIDNLRDIDTVEIAILVREARDDTYKVTMRSKLHADVCAIARSFGGGGHLRAAGCTLASNEWPDGKQKLIDAARAAMITV